MFLWQKSGSVRSVHAKKLAYLAISISLKQMKNKMNGSKLYENRTIKS